MHKNSNLLSNQKAGSYYLESTQIGSGEELLCRNYLAGTPESSKQHIVESIWKIEGHVRVLICTIAFGMGIDLKGARRVHFCPSQTAENYLQECG